MKFNHTKRQISNRSVPTDAFLEELVTVIRNMPDEVFYQEYGSISEPDIYDHLAIRKLHGVSTLVRKALMCEVLMILSQLESSGNWAEGRDIMNPKEAAIEQASAGIFQISANTMDRDQRLWLIFQRFSQSKHLRNSNSEYEYFRHVMKTNHQFAIEYCVQLLRFTVEHHGPLARGELFRHVSRDSIEEFSALLKEKPKIKKKKMTPKNILIGPGHGGKDSGAMGWLMPSGDFPGKTYYEKDIALDIGNELFELLISDSRYNVTSTRTTDVFVSLSDIVKQANREKAILIAIHLNSFREERANGFEGWTSKGQTESDKVAEAILKRTQEGLPGWAGRFSKDDGDLDKESDFYVLRHTEGPAYLHEAGFMTSQRDLQIMTQPEFPEKMAIIIKAGLDDYHGFGPVEDEVEDDNPDIEERPDIEDPEKPSADEFQKMAAWLEEQAKF